MEKGEESSLLDVVPRMILISVYLALMFAKTSTIVVRLIFGCYVGAQAKIIRSG